MNLDQISIKNFILALFKRDDGERILLGSGAYEFDADLQHFAANIIANDVIEKQGTDGQLLAGQVRRSAPQSFDGYVGDATTTREDTENYRRAFIRFFQPRHFYTVIYILPDGSAIQRKNGYLTDAPAVPEQYQRMPHYHVALAFEDLNYYSYAEDAQGEETYAQTVDLQPESELTGGLVWDETTGLTISQIEGDTEQTGTPSPSSPKTIKTVSGEQVVAIDGKDYALSLGSIVLCKISTAQDYIYKDGADWKLHKTIASDTRDVQVNGISYSSSATNQASRVGAFSIINSTWTSYSTTAGLARLSTNIGTYKLDPNVSANLGAESMEDGTFCQRQGTNDRLYFKDSSLTGKTGDQVKAILLANSGGTNLWWPLATPTETVITNAVLIKQLNAINAALRTTTTAPTATTTSTDAIPAFLGTSNITTDDGIIWTAETAGGKNIFNPSATPWAPKVAYNASGDRVNWNGYYGIEAYQPVEPNTTYHFSNSLNMGTYYGLVFYDATKNKISNISARTSTFTTPANCYFIRFAIGNNVSDPPTWTQLEKGSSATAYERFIPLGGAVWDAETGHATTTFTVNGLYAVNPIWTVPGPAESPLIENITNGTSLSYLGQIPAGQSLIVDCGKQTATIAGANVKNNVRGTWQTFEPGQITIRYSGANITGPSSLKWNEVVG